MRSGQGTANDLLYHFCVPVSRFRHQKAARRRLCVVLAGGATLTRPTILLDFVGRVRRSRHPATTLTLRRRSPRDSFASSSADLLFSTVQITTAPNRSKTASTANSGLKPIVSASAPTTSANRVLAVQRPSRSGRWRWRLRYDQTRRTRA